MSRVVQACVKFEGRAPPKALPDLVWGVIFFGLFMAQIISMLYIIFDTNTSGDFLEEQVIDCPGTTISRSFYSFKKISQSTKEEWCACRSKYGNWGRRLSRDSTKYTMYTFFEKRPEVPAIMGVTVLAISVAWLILLRYFAKPIIFATMFIQAGIGYVFAAVCFYYDLTTQAILCLIGASAFLVYVFVRRQKFINAGNFMSLSVKGLGKQWSIFFVLLPLQVLYCLFLWLNTQMWFAVFSNVTVDEEHGCNLVADGTKHYKLGLFCTCTFIWTLFFIKHLSLHITAMSIGSWAFHQDEQHQNPALKGLKVGLTRSAPVLAVSSFIVALTENLRRRAANKLSWLNPFHITGDSFCTSATDSFQMLKRHLESVLVTDFAGKSVLNFGQYLFTVAIGLATWAWFDACTKMNTLEPETWTRGGEHPIVLFWLAIFCFLFFCKHPMVTIFVVNLVADSAPKEASGLLAGLFIGAIGGLIFAFVGDIILYSIDTIYICYAIQKEAGVEIDTKHPETGQVYYLLQAPESQGGILQGKHEPGVAMHQPVYTTSAAPAHGAYVSQPAHPSAGVVYASHQSIPVAQVTQNTQLSPVYQPPNVNPYPNTDL